MLSFDQLYTLARDWAESEAEACGPGPLPDWSPPFQVALGLAGGDPDGATQVQQLASDAWERTRRYWPTN